MEKQKILLTEVPSDYIKITSGLGEAKPLNIIVLPVLFEGSVHAVIELAGHQQTVFAVANRLKSFRPVKAIMGIA